MENAWQDATRFKKPGLTTILVYPTNALANDQELRINQYLAESGLAGAVSVAKYDRGTSQAEREHPTARAALKVLGSRRTHQL